MPINIYSKACRLLHVNNTIKIHGEDSQEQKKLLGQKDRS